MCEIKNKLGKISYILIVQNHVHIKKIMYVQKMQLNNTHLRNYNDVQSRRLLHTIAATVNLLRH